MKKLAVALLFVAACSKEQAVAPPSTTSSAATESAPSPSPQQPPAAARPQPVQGPKLQLVDEASRDASFAAYRERLLAAVRARDAKAVAALADPNIRTSFGGDGGRADLERMLPNIWTDFEQLLTLGGTFREEMFWAPYVYSAFPDDHDAFETLAVVGDDVPLRATPDASAVAIATLSRDLVKRGAPATGEEMPWIQVETADGRSGFVEARFVRSPVGYRAGFVKSNEAWQMNALVAGD